MRLLQGLLIIISLLFVFACNQKPDLKKPNVIMILVDDLGKEWISAYGAEGVKTPHIDALANSGIKFNNAYSMPQCTPSRVALLTGQYPFQNGWVDHYDVPRWGHNVRFDPEQNNVFAQKMKEVGYKTCIAGKWQLNDFRIEPDILTNIGFDEYCMWTGGEGGDNIEQSEKRYWDPYIHTKDGSRTYEGKFGPDIFSDFIVNFMRENKEKPMCIYYPMVLTHTPFVNTPSDMSGTTNYEKHCSMVRYTDFIVGKIVKEVNRLGLSDNTYIILTTDNGTTSKIINKRNGQCIPGGKMYLTENGINAPFIVKVPEGYDGNRESDALIDFTDIFPTLLDIGGVDNIQQFNTNGQSFLNILNEEKVSSSKKWVLSMGCHPATIDSTGRMQNYCAFRDRVIRLDNFKIYIDRNQKANRVFDLKNDPYELNNIMSSDKLSVQFWEEVDKVIATMPAKDNQPAYEKASTSYFDISIPLLNKMSSRTHKKKNMHSIATEKEYLNQMKKK